MDANRKNKSTKVKQNQQKNIHTLYINERDFQLISFHSVNSQMFE